MMKLIAETAFHHQGDFSFQKKLVQVILQKSRADVVKFHLLLNFDEYMMRDHPLYPKTKDWIFGREQWRDIIQLTKNSDKELMLLYNDSAAVEFGTQFEPSLVEIHSVCLNDIFLLDSLKNNIDRHTKIVLGVGGSSLYEIENAINILQHPHIVLMFGFQNYPTQYEDINFSKIRRIMKLFPEFEFGYADHTAWNEPNNVLITLLGAALGMAYVEKHVTIAYGEERIDWSAAVSIEMFNEIRKKMDLLEACNSDGLLRLNEGERSYSIFGPMKKAAVVTRDLKEGKKLEKGSFAFQRTGQISDLSQVEVLESIGSRVVQNVNAGQVLLRAHIRKLSEEN